MNIKGRAIRHLLQNEMLGKEGAFSWNGNTDSGGKAAIGMYVVYISLFNMDGVTKEFKKVCVLAGHIN